MKYSVKVWDEVFYPDVEADSPEQAEQIALEWFDERDHATQIEKSKTFQNALFNVKLTDEILKIITKCPSLEKKTCQDCLDYCPLARVCYTYWTGEDE